MKFTRNDTPSIGVEIELQLVDEDSLGLTSRIHEILDRLPDDLKQQIKPELMQCYLEINTGVCRTVADAGNDLTDKLVQLEKVLDPMGLKLFWAGTHPFSLYRDQEITVNDRYHRLVDLMQEVARRLVTFGLHIHIGVDTGDKAILVCERIMRHLPTLLAMSVNSPFWEGQDNGLQSNRSKVMEGLPTAGIPYRMRNWSEYTWLINHLIDTGFINSIREIWWDVRPHHNFGTVEIRVCDMPPSLDHVLSITALVQCLVVAISEEIDEGTFQSEYHPMMVQQNKWRAIRYGDEAVLVDPADFRRYSVAEEVGRLVGKLGPVADRLGCSQELEGALRLPGNTGAAQQHRLLKETGDTREMVRRMIEANHWSRKSG